MTQTQLPPGPTGRFVAPSVTMRLRNGIKVVVRERVGSATDDHRAATRVHYAAN